MFMNKNSLFLLLSLLGGTSAQCGIGAIYNEQRNKCFQYYPAAVDYETAESVCFTLNGHMVSIHNLDDNTFLSQEATQYINGNGPVWLGAQAHSQIVTNPNNWKWTDGTPFDYQNYKIGQPISLGSYSCMQFSTRDGKWLTANCEDDFPFICASDPFHITTTSCPPPQEIIRCPSGFVWFYATNSCYKVVIKWVHYPDALSACYALGADLASVHSYAENDFLTDLSKTGLSVSKHISVYIGLIYTNGYWHWTDGTSTDYLNWASGEPNNMKKEFWTAIMPDPIGKGYDPDGGEWNNVENINNRGYICKRPAKNI